MELETNRELILDFCILFDKSLYIQIFYKYY